MEVTASEIDALVAASDMPEAERGNKLTMLKLRLQQVLLPMVSSQCKHISSIVQTYEARKPSSEGTAEVTPVRKLKMQHMLKFMEGRQREIRDLLNLCSELVEQSGEDPFASLPPLKLSQPAELQRLSVKRMTRTR